MLFAEFGVVGCEGCAAWGAPSASGVGGDGLPFGFFGWVEHVGGCFLCCLCEELLAEELFFGVGACVGCVCVEVGLSVACGVYGVAFAADFAADVVIDFTECCFCHSCNFWGFRGFVFWVNWFGLFGLFGGRLKSTFRQGVGGGRLKSTLRQGFVFVD